VTGLADADDVTSAPAGDGGAVQIVPVTAECWGDVVQLFERPGPRGGTPIVGHCWCMAWRDEQGARPARKAAFKEAVDTGRPLGMLAYVNGRPVGWVAVSPREEQPRLQRSRSLGPLPDDEAIWAVTCFYVEPPLRGGGLASALLDAAIEYARRSGAGAIDAFPKADLAPHATASRQAEASYSWMGRRGSYESRGFVPIRAAGKRVVMRLLL
jgi:GNAT superfamily N-acetyltransferase